MEQIGIYSITNTVTGKRYIGSAMTLNKRRREHFRMLSLGIHHSAKLQNSWNKHGKDAFIFELLILCSPAELINREQEYIDKFNSASTKGYNICSVAGNCRGVYPSAETRKKIGEASRKRGQTTETRAKLSALKKGKPFSDAHKAALRKPKADTTKIREAKLGSNNPNFGKPRSEETRRRIAEAQKGVPRKPPSEETKAKMRAAHARRRVPFVDTQ